MKFLSSNRESAITRIIDTKKPIGSAIFKLSIMKYWPKKMKMSGRLVSTLLLLIPTLTNCRPIHQSMYYASAEFSWGRIRLRTSSRNFWRIRLKDYLTVIIIHLTKTLASIIELKNVCVTFFFRLPSSTSTTQTEFFDLGYICCLFEGKKWLLPFCTKCWTWRKVQKRISSSRLFFSTDLGNKR